MRRALWLNELPDFDPLARELAADQAERLDHKPTSSDSVGRPGLDPGTLGLKGRVQPSAESCEVHSGSSSGVSCPLSPAESLLTQGIQ